MPNLLKKLIIALVISSQLFLLTSGLFTKSASALTGQRLGPWYDQNFSQWYMKVYSNDSPPSEIFGERYTAAQVQWVLYSWFAILFNLFPGREMMTCAFSGDVGTCADAILNIFASGDQEQYIAQKQDKTLLQSMFGDRSPSFVGYVRERAEKFNLVPEAEAQSFGITTALHPIRNMWRASRNASYGLFILGIVVMAFMIMFRVKTSPQTAVTIQSAIPKIIITLALVTFSFAIAGLLIDLMYVVIGLISFVGRHFFPFFQATPTTATVFDWMTLGFHIGGKVSLGFFGAMITFLMLAAITFLFIMGGMLGAIGSVVMAPVILLVYLIMGIIMIVALFVIGIKTLFMLIKAYAMVLLLTIFAPLQITAGLFIPGIGFGRWLRSYVSNLAVFVVTGTLLLLSFVFMFQSAALMIQSAITGNALQVLSNLIFGTQVTETVIAAAGAEGWPPLLVGPGPQGAAANQSTAAFLFYVTSIVVFFMIPKAGDMVKSAMSGQPFAMGSAIGEALGPTTAAGRAGVTYGVAEGAEILERSAPTPYGVPAGWKASAAKTMRKAAGIK